MHKLGTTSNVRAWALSLHGAWSPAISRIARNPLAAPAVHLEVRRVLLKRFPYSVFYLMADDTLIVLSCVHTRRASVDWSVELK
jgi:hypothetical protein